MKSKGGNPTSGKAQRKGVFSSQLAMSFMAVFLFVAVIQGSFLGILCLDVTRANQLADRQRDLLKGSQEISHLIKIAQQLFDTISDARKNPAMADVDGYRGQYETLKASSAHLGDEFERLGLDRAPLARIDDAFEQLHDGVEGIITHLQSFAEGDRTPERVMLDKAQNLYEQFAFVLKYVHDSASKPQGLGPFLGIEPQKLLYIAAAVDLFMVILLLLSVELVITGPLRRLQRNCARIQKGEAIDAPQHVRTEICSLEQSFHEMSLVISDNEKRRHNFLEFFQSVQKAALNHVMSLFNELSHSDSMSDRAKKNIQKARNNITTLLELLQSMTEALSHSAEGEDAEIEPHFAECSAPTLAANASLAIEALLQNSQVKLNIAVPKLTFTSDATLIGRVLVNFLSNAIKYSPKGGEITLKMVAVKDTLRFSVIDQGPGISEENQKKLFTEFGQVSSADGIKRAGTGLGLVSCKQIVEAHGGHVGVRSEVGKGSTFWFELPKSPPARAAAPVKAKSKDKAKSKTNSNGKSKGFGFGLKPTIAAMLMCFLIPQAAIGYKLHSLFSEASAQAEAFAFKKEYLLRLEEMLGDHLAWKISIVRAMDKEDLGAMGASAAFLDPSVASCEWLLERIPRNDYNAERLTKVRNGMRAMQKFQRFVQARKDKMNIMGLAVFLKQARKIMKETEHTLFDSLDMGESDVKTYFEFSSRLRTETMYALGAAAGVDLILFLIVMLVGLRITNRITQLKQKAEDFSHGERLERTIKGSDELSYLDERLCEVSQAIRESDAQRQKMIAVINHDLRTPLASIINGVQMILASGYGQICDREAQIAKAAEAELNRLLQQINDLLLIEKIDAGLYELTSERFQLVPLLASTAKSMSEETSAKALTVVPRLTPKSKDGFVVGDKSLVEREFAILLSNAIHAAPKGSAVEIEVDLTGGTFYISVKDKGGGIKNELLPHIFERFRFVNNRPVTGLGLPLAQRLSQLHGGSLELISTAQGTEAIMTLPVAAAA